MTSSIRWKIVASYFILVLLFAAVLFVYLNHLLEKNLLRDLKENLFNEARLVKLMSEKEISDLRRDAPALAAKTGKSVKARVTMVALGGEVVGDSELSSRNIGKLDNHGDRPEVMDAFAKGSGSSIRYSTTLKTYMLYVSLPFTTASGERGAVRLALPLSQIENAKASVTQALVSALALAFACSIILGFALSKVTTRPLRTMAAAAARIGRGDLSYRIPITGKDETAELATVMNEMALQLEMQISRLSTEKSRLDTILSSMGEGLMVTDRYGTVTLTNPSFRTLFSLGEYVEGESLIELTRQPALHDSLKKVLASGEEFLQEITIRTPEEKILLTHWVPLREQGTMGGLVAVFHDISDLKKLENVRRDFVANVSHELRTPVAVIKGYAETLISDGESMEPEQVSRFSRIIHNHAERLTILISDLLTLSQLESGKLEMSVRPVPLKGAINRVFGLLESKAGEKEIVMSQELHHGESAVLADLGRLEQVLVNLLDNAVKYTPPKGSIKVTTEDSGEMVRINVADTGIGIPAKDILRIFERFYRVDAARSRDLGGTGLGLSIVKHIVQSHGGTVSVQSSPGMGSTFSFTLRKA